MAETMISSFDGTKLYLNRETEAGNRAIAVIVHGLCEHQGRYDYMAKCLHESGIGTYRFDHRGHGRSEGEDTYYGDFNEMLDDVNVVVDMAIANHPDLPVFLIGHSMGGFAVSLYGVKYPDKRLRGIVTSGADPRFRQSDHRRSGRTGSPRKAAQRAGRRRLLRGRGGRLVRKRPQQPQNLYIRSLLRHRGRLKLVLPQKAGL